MAKIYMICPVRNATEDQLKKMAEYVAKLEAAGNKVHYPPRDVDQRNDDGGVRICLEHREAMVLADEVHVWWDDSSKGSHFDLGMAFANMVWRKAIQNVKVNFVLANPVEWKAEKSFQNVLLAMSGLNDNPFKQQGFDQDANDHHL